MGIVTGAAHGSTAWWQKDQHSHRPATAVPTSALCRQHHAMSLRPRDLAKEPGHTTSHSLLYAAYLPYQPPSPNLAQPRHKEQHDSQDYRRGCPSEWLVCGTLQNACSRSSAAQRKRYEPGLATLPSAIEAPWLFDSLMLLPTTPRGVALPACGPLHGCISRLLWHLLLQEFARLPSLSAGSMRPLSRCRPHTRQGYLAMHLATIYSVT